MFMDADSFCRHCLDFILDLTRILKNKVCSKMSLSSNIGSVNRYLENSGFFFLARSLTVFLFVFFFFSINRGHP